MAPLRSLLCVAGLLALGSKAAEDAAFPCDEAAAEGEEGACQSDGLSALQVASQAAAEEKEDLDAEYRACKEVPRRSFDRTVCFKGDALDAFHFRFRVAAEKEEPSFTLLFTGPGESQKIDGNLNFIQSSQQGSVHLLGLNQAADEVKVHNVRFCEGDKVQMALDSDLAEEPVMLSMKETECAPDFDKLAEAENEATQLVEVAAKKSEIKPCWGSDPPPTDKFPVCFRGSYMGANFFAKIRTYNATENMGKVDLSVKSAFINGRLRNKDCWEGKHKRLFIKDINRISKSVHVTHMKWCSKFRQVHIHINKPFDTTIEMNMGRCYR